MIVELVFWGFFGFFFFFNWVCFSFLLLFYFSLYWFSLGFQCDRLMWIPVSVREMVVDDGGCVGCVGSVREMIVLKK